MEKIDVISFEDEEGVHIIPISNIGSICKEIGKYNYRTFEYTEKYSQPRYVIRMISGSEYFYVTKQIYEKLEKNIYNIILTDKRKKI